MARPDVRGAARYLPTPVQSAIGVVALSAILSGAAVERRRRRAGRAAEANGEQTLWATSGSTRLTKDRRNR